MPHFESGVLEAGVLLHLVARNSYGQVAFKQCRYCIYCTEQSSNGRHGLMYFDIALTYHATINVA